MKTWFANRDYEVLDANALAPFMKAQLADGEPSVIVFAMAADPATVSTVLLIDEIGLAAAWVGSFGGPDGTGLVAVPLQTARGFC